MKRWLPNALISLVLGLLAGTGHAATVTLAWDQNVEVDLAGYKIYYGTASKAYEWFIDVGNVTTYTVLNLSDGVTYYFAVTAYNTSQRESAYSNEVVNCIWADSANLISTYFDAVQKIYIGYYHRPADAGGLIYWAEHLCRNSGNLNEIIEAHANSAESQALYGTINSSNVGTVVDAIYVALFSRPAEAEGKAYYVDGFNADRFTAATIMLNILDGAQNEDLLSVNNKLTAANSFTRTIDPELDGYDFQVTYAGNSDAIAGRDYLASVTWDPTTVPTQEEITSYMQTYIADPGDPILNR